MTALRRYDPVTAAACEPWIENPPPFGDDYIGGYLDVIEVEFLGKSGGRRRIQRLPDALHRMNRFLEGYAEFAQQAEADGKRHGVSPQALSWWPDDFAFRW